MKSTYQKVRFTSRNGSTAGLIFESSKLENLSLSDVSRFFPYSESGKMAKVQYSPEFNTWLEAFGYSFPEIY